MERRSRWRLEQHVCPYSICLQYGQHGQRVHQRNQLHHLLGPQTTAACLSSTRPAMWLRAICVRSPAHSLPHGDLPFQSTSIKNVTMNGDFRYTKANMNLPNYYETSRSVGESATAAGVTPHTPRRQSALPRLQAARRQSGGSICRLWLRLAGDKDVSLSDQVDYSNVHQPAPPTFVRDHSKYVHEPNETIILGYAGSGSNLSVEGSANGTALPDYFGQRFLTNN